MRIGTIGTGRGVVARQVFACICGLAVLSGCVKPAERLPEGKAAYEIVSRSDGTLARGTPIGPLDVIAIDVFGEPDMSRKDLVVDSTGIVLVPLIGAIEAAGKTAEELSRELERELRAHYLRDPHVVVLLQNSAAQRVTVEGEVKEPGVYDLKGRTTLVDAVARAKGLSTVARPQEVVILRTIDGTPMGARFNLAAIRRGEQSDPLILGGDKVIVGYSNLRGIWRDILTAAPLASVFVTLGRY